LVIVGDGPDRPKVESLVKELGLVGVVHLTGHVEAPQPLYRGFDLFVQSSDTEQMPLSVLEAMAAGLPVVATDVGDIRAMVAPDNRPFIVPCDDDQFARALCQMLDDPGLRHRLGDANRFKAAAEYNRDDMVAAWRDLLDGSS
jgi:glycosyltransferase involved in cell wall biosynthesis